jgi:hypothetical protein
MTARAAKKYNIQRARVLESLFRMTSAHTEVVLNPRHPCGFRPTIGPAYHRSPAATDATHADGQTGLYPTSGTISSALIEIDAPLSLAGLSAIGPRLKSSA